MGRRLARLKVRRAAIFKSRLEVPMSSRSSMYHSWCVMSRRRVISPVRRLMRSMVMAGDSIQW